MKYIMLVLLTLVSITGNAQLEWKEVTAEFGPLPQSIKVYKTVSPIDGKPNIAFYVVTDLSDKKLSFRTDTTLKRRLSPADFYEKNGNPYVVMNGTFFSFQTHQNLNLVIRNGKLVGYNIHSLAGRGKDTLTWIHPLGSAIGIFKNRQADVAWTFTDSTLRNALASQIPVPFLKDSVATLSLKNLKEKKVRLRKWKPEVAIGGGPVLLQDGDIQVTNNEEWKFAGKAIEDKHPRSAMGYTTDGKLILLVIQGRMPGVAEGSTLVQMAQILKDLGCVEALNLDGGGSSCLLVNGKETIKPSDKEGQRAVPGVFVIGGNR